MSVEKAVLLESVADNLSRLLKMGIPKNMTYSRGVIGASVVALRELAEVERTPSQASWSATPGECDYIGCKVNH